MAQRPGRVGVAQCLQPGLRRLRRQPGHLAGQPRHRIEQRAVEQLLVQPPDLRGVLAPRRSARPRSARPGRCRGCRLGRAGHCGPQRSPAGRAPAAVPPASPGRACAARPGRRAGCGSAAAAAAGAGARRCAGTGRRRPGWPRPPGPRSRPSASAASAGSVAGLRSVSSLRPCTSWSSCTANSMSRSPPGPSLSWRPAWPGGQGADHPAAHRLHVLDEVVALRRPARPAA